MDRLAATSGKDAFLRLLAYAALVGNHHVVERLAAKAIKSACLMDRAALLLRQSMGPAVQRPAFAGPPAVAYSWNAWLLDYAVFQGVYLMEEFVVERVNITMADNAATLAQLSVAPPDAVRGLVKAESACQIQMVALLPGVLEALVILLLIVPTRMDMTWSVRKAVVFTRKIFHSLMRYLASGGFDH